MQKNLLKKGELYIVSTPIGNLSDITIRALKVLELVDYIFAEDTRHTSKLLKEYKLEKELVSYRDQNHSKVISKIVDLLSNGNSIALVSDAGTPLVSDPGYKLVRDVIENGFEVVSIPGPTAAIAALTCSGLPTDKFCFLGFLPKSVGKREKILNEYLEKDGTVILYESPFRIHKLLTQLSELFPLRQVAVVKDVTKLYERKYRGTPEQILTMLPDKDRMKGEYTVLIEKS